MILTRRSFLHASLMAGGLVAVPQFGRWFREPDKALYLYADGIHDDWPALQALANGGHTLRGNRVVPGRGDWMITRCSLRLSRTLVIPPWNYWGNHGTLTFNVVTWAERNGDPMVTWHGVTSPVSARLDT